MKLIQCIIQPFKLEELVDALQNVVIGMTVSEAKGHGHQKGHPIVYRGHEYEVSLLPKVMIEIAADDNRVDEIVKVATQIANTGQIGAGRIFVLPLEQCYHVRTGFLDVG